jgi:molybdopterin molybdotransferase
VGAGTFDFGLAAAPLVTRSFESRSADWLDVDEALSRVMKGAEPLAAQSVALESSVGFALAEDVVADVTLPPWDNSAMDGYAVRSNDVRGASASTPVRLTVARQIRAGDPPGALVGEGEAVRIMTGAPVPPGADSVVRVEDTDAEGESGIVQIVRDRDAEHNVRPAGQDMSPGELLLARGHTISPGSVGVLAAAGLDPVPVHRPASVAILTTGDELRGPDRFDDVRAGIGIPDSNGPLLAAMVAEGGGIPTRLGIAGDNPGALTERIEQAAEADVLVTIGGASMGEADLVKRVLDEMGYEHDFWRVRMRPGSPIGFGWLPRGTRRQPVFSLPGNPASAFVTFEVFVRPFLRRLGGHVSTERRRVSCRASAHLRTPAELTYFLRVAVDRTPHDATFRLTGSQGSGLVSGLAKTEGLAIISEDVSEIQEGDEVTVMLIREP